MKRTRYLFISVLTNFTYLFTNYVLNLGEYLPDSTSSMMGGALNKKRIKLSRNDLGAVYECRASSQALNKSLSLKVEILVNGELFFIHVISSYQLLIGG